MNKMANDPRLLVLDDDGQINFQFLATVHDSILYQMPITFASQLPDMLSIIKDHLTHTFTYRGRSFTIGVDAKIGYNWGKDMIELKDFGSESVYNALEQLGIQV
jgi:hypothetical protein